MIRIVLLGRTGNILFQYALGTMLARKHGVPLVLDASWYNSEGWSEISHLLRLPLDATVSRRFSLASRAYRNLTHGNHFWQFLNVPFLREPTDDQSFNPEFADAPADCVLFGYFQTPRYFEPIAGSLRKEIAGLLEQVPLQSPAGLQSRLAAPTSVAVHVRRTDYLVHPALQVCDSAYYRQSIQHMRALVPGARFFIFSDDPDWCRRQFAGDDTEVVDSGPAAANPLHDLRLMGMASHHIIANSSYSWWAAWLAQRPGHHVIMPERWIADDSINAPIAEKR
ncbi:MAG: alpha-1,2-fucosyltransferase, partial [Verrucomicrobiales bacterium]